MARSNSIRWNKTLQNQLKREIKGYNARIDYAYRNGVPIEKLPSKVRYTQVREIISSKTEYNSIIRSLKGATFKTLKPGKSGQSRYIKREAEKAAKIVNKGLSELQGIMPNKPQRLVPKLEKITDVDELGKVSVPKTSKEAEVLGKADLLTVKGKFPDDRSFLIKNIGLTSGEGEENYRKLQEWITANEESSMRWKQNYLKGLNQSMEIALATGDESALDELKNLYTQISQMDLKTFLIGQLTKYEQVAQDYIYQGRDGQWTARLARISKEWSTVYG